MKIPSLMLSFSVVANVALLAWLFVPQNDPEPVARDISKTGTLASGTGAERAKSSAHRTQVSLWHRLNPGGDLAAVVTRLRAAGFPPDVVRAITAMLVTEQFDAERYKIDEAALHTPYWKAWSNSYSDPKVGPALRKLQRDQQEMMKRLLGDTAANEGTEEAKAWQQLSTGNLSSEKQERLKAYLASFQERQMQLYSAIGQTPTMLAADREKMAALDKSMRDGLGEFLTTEEVNEYTLRNGGAANELKWRLGPFHATEEEYRTIFPLYQMYRDQFPMDGSPGGPPNAPIDPAQKMAQDAMLAQLASGLGQQRAEDVKLALDPRYAGLNRLVDRLNLPLSAAKQVFEVQQDIEQRAAALRNDASLAPAERTEHLASLADEASAKISVALGSQRGLDAYKQNGGQWLSTLVPEPPPKT